MADLMAISAGHREFAAGEHVIYEGDAPAGIHFLIAGWTASSMAVDRTTGS